MAQNLVSPVKMVSGYDIPVVGYGVSPLVPAGTVHYTNSVPNRFTKRLSLYASYLVHTL